MSTDTFSPELGPSAEDTSNAEALFDPAFVDELKTIERQVLAEQTQLDPMLSAELKAIEQRVLGEKLSSGLKPEIILQSDQGDISAEASPQNDAVIAELVQGLGGEDGSSEHYSVMSQEDDQAAREVLTVHNTHSGVTVIESTRVSAEDQPSAEIAVAESLDDYLATFNLRQTDTESATPSEPAEALDILGAEQNEHLIITKWNPGLEGYQVVIGQQQDGQIHEVPYIDLYTELAQDLRDRLGSDWEIAVASDRSHILVQPRIKTKLVDNEEVPKTEDELRDDELVQGTTEDIMRGIVDRSIRQ